LSSKTLMLVATFALGLFSLAALWIVFELRYVWYVQPDQLMVLRLGFTAVAGSIVALWVLYPSRVAVGLLGFSCLAFPPLFDSRFVGITPGFLLWVALILSLLLGATQLRRRQVVN
jgi:hypothetical protein